MEYIAYLHKDSGSDFGVSFPDFPGCVTAGKTLEEARRLTPQALALHVAGMAADGERIPDPATLDRLARDAARRGAIAFVVTLEPPRDRTVRINIAVRQSQIKKIDARAKQLGLSRSAFLIQTGLGSVGKGTRRRA